MGIFIEYLNSRSAGLWPTAPDEHTLWDPPTTVLQRNELPSFSTLPHSSWTTESKLRFRHGSVRKKCRRPLPSSAASSMLSQLHVLSSRPSCSLPQDPPRFICQIQGCDAVLNSWWALKSHQRASHPFGRSIRQPSSDIRPHAGRQNIRPPSVIQPSRPFIDIQLPAATQIQTIRPPAAAHTIPSSPADRTISPPVVIQTTQPTDIQAVQPAANVLETQTIESPAKVPGNEGRSLATHRSSVSRKVLEDVQPPRPITSCNPTPPQPDGPPQNTRSRPIRNVPSQVEPRRILPAPPIATSKQVIRPPGKVSEENERSSGSGQGTSWKTANSDTSIEKPKKKVRKQQPHLFKIFILTPPTNPQTDNSASSSLPPAPIPYQFAFVDGLPRALRPNADGSFRHWDPSQLKES